MHGARRGRSRTPPAAAHADCRRASTRNRPPGAAGLPLGDREDDTLLLASELVTNAVVHAGLEPGEPIEVAAECDRRSARVEVRDEGKGFRLCDSNDGYGLHVVASAAARWGIERDGATRVWFELR